MNPVALRAIFGSESDFLDDAACEDVSGDDEDDSGAYFLLRICFTLIGVIVFVFFSRGSFR